MNAWNVIKNSRKAILAGLLLACVLIWATAPAHAAKSRARAVVVMDALSGQFVEEIDADRKVGPASLAKMMTLYLIYLAVEQGQVTWDDEVLISAKAWGTGGSKMFVRERDRIPLKKMAQGIGIVSGNDACIAVAEHLSGSEEGFVEWMNEEGAKIGLTDTYFGTATGLPVRRQITTARDMARMGRALITRFPASLDILSTLEFTHEKITQPNRNGLLTKGIGVDGIKTGHTEGSGYHLVASAKKGDQRFVVVIMGTKSQSAREEEAQRYLMTAFRTFATIDPLKTGAPIAEAVVWKGAADTLSVVPEEIGFVTVRRGQESTVSVTYELPDVVAPVTVGQQVGTLQVHVGEEVVREVSLVAANGVEQGGLFKRLWHGLLLFLSGWLDKLF